MVLLKKEAIFHYLYMLITYSIWKLSSMLFDHRLIFESFNSHLPSSKTFKPWCTFISDLIIFLNVLFNIFNLLFPPPPGTANLVWLWSYDFNCILDMSRQNRSQPLNFFLWRCELRKAHLIFHVPGTYLTRLQTWSIFNQ